MATKSRTVQASSGHEGTAQVDDFMVALDHPERPLIEALRVAIRGADPSIVEGVKWNAPSFRTTEYFATMHLRAKEGVGVILLLGAKVRDLPGVPVADPEGLLKWLAKDRAMVALSGLDHLHALTPAFAQIVRQWIRHV